MKRKYKVLYTHQKTKKRKTWQDGTIQLSVDEKRGSLFDGSSKQLSTFYLNKKKVEIGVELESDKYLIEVEEEIAANLSNSSTQNSQGVTTEEKCDSPLEHAATSNKLKTKFNVPRKVQPKPGIKLHQKATAEATTRVKVRTQRHGFGGNQPPRSRVKASFHPLNKMLHTSYVVASLDKMLHDDYLGLVDFDKQQINEPEDEVPASNIWSSMMDDCSSSVLPQSSQKFFPTIPHQVTVATKRGTRQLLQLFDENEVPSSNPSLLKPQAKNFISKNSIDDFEADLPAFLKDEDSHEDEKLDEPISTGASSIEFSASEHEAAKSKELKKQENGSEMVPHPSPTAVHDVVVECVECLLSAVDGFVGVEIDNDANNLVKDTKYLPDIGGNSGILSQKNDCLTNPNLNLDCEVANRISFGETERKGMESKLAEKGNIECADFLSNQPDVVCSCEEIFTCSDKMKEEALLLKANLVSNCGKEMSESMHEDRCAKLGNFLEQNLSDFNLFSTRNLPSSATSQKCGGSAEMEPTLFGFCRKSFDLQGNFENVAGLSFTKPVSLLKDNDLLDACVPDFDIGFSQLEGSPELCMSEDKSVSVDQVTEDPCAAPSSPGVGFKAVSKFYSVDEDSEGDFFKQLDMCEEKCLNRDKINAEDCFNATSQGLSARAADQDGMLVSESQKEVITNHVEQKLSLANHTKEGTLLANELELDSLPANQVKIGLTTNQVEVKTSSANQVGVGLTAYQLSSCVATHPHSPGEGDSFSYSPLRSSQLSSGTSASGYHKAQPPGPGSTTTSQVPETCSSCECASALRRVQECELSQKAPSCGDQHVPSLFEDFSNVSDDEALLLQVFSPSKPTSSVMTSRSCHKENIQVDHDCDDSTERISRNHLINYDQANKDKLNYATSIYNDVSYNLMTSDTSRQSDDTTPLFVLDPPQRRFNNPYRSSLIPTHMNTLRSSLGLDGMDQINDDSTPYLSFSDSSGGYSMKMMGNFVRRTPELNSCFKMIQKPVVLAQSEKLNSTKDVCVGGSGGVAVSGLGGFVAGACAGGSGGVAIDAFASGFGGVVVDPGVSGSCGVIVDPCAGDSSRVCKDHSYGGRSERLAIPESPSCVSWSDSKPAPNMKFTDKESIARIGGVLSKQAMTQHGGGHLRSHLLTPRANPFQPDGEALISASCTPSGYSNQKPFVCGKSSTGTKWSEYCNGNPGMDKYCLLSSRLVSSVPPPTSQSCEYDLPVTPTDVPFHQVPQISRKRSSPSTKNRRGGGCSEFGFNENQSNFFHPFHRSPIPSVQPGFESHHHRSSKWEKYLDHHVPNRKKQRQRWLEEVVEREKAAQSRSLYIDADVLKTPDLHRRQTNTQGNLWGSY